MTDTDPLRQQIAKALYLLIRSGTPGGRDAAVVQIETELDHYAEQQARQRAPGARGPGGRSEGDGLMTDTDGLRQQITDALRFHRWRSSGDFIACACGHVPESSLHMEDHRASSLLPIVTAWAEQQARQRAAEELRAAAEEGWGPPDQDYIYPEVSDWLHARADALTSEDPASSLGRK